MKLNDYFAKNILGLSKKLSATQILPDESFFDLLCINSLLNINNISST